MSYFSHLWDTAKDNPATLSSFISALAAVCSAVVAMFAVLLSSIVSIVVARRQIRASLVAGNRQAWINALRDDLSELFELLEWLKLLRAGTYNDAEGYRFVDERRSRIRLLKNRIKLRLNNTEPDHQNLIKSIDTLAAAAEAGWCEASAEDF